MKRAKRKALLIMLENLCELYDEIHLCADGYRWGLKRLPNGTYNMRSN